MTIIDHTTHALLFFFLSFLLLMPYSPPFPLSRLLSATLDRMDWTGPRFDAYFRFSLP